MQVRPSVNGAAGARLPLPERRDGCSAKTDEVSPASLGPAGWFPVLGRRSGVPIERKKHDLDYRVSPSNSNGCAPSGAAWISRVGWMWMCDVNITVFLLLLHCNTAFSRTQEENVRFIHKNPRSLSCKMHKECVKKHTNTLDLCNPFADQWLFYPFRPICCVHRRNARNGHWLQGRCGQRNDRRLRLQSPVEKGKRLGNWREIIVRRFLPFCFRVRAVPSSSYRRSYPACRTRR